MYVSMATCILIHKGTHDRQPSERIVTYVHGEVARDGLTAKEDAANERQPVPHRGHHDGRHLPVVARVRVLALFEQEAHHGQAAAPSGRVDRRCAQRAQREAAPVARARARRPLRVGILLGASIAVESLPAANNT